MRNTPLKGMLNTASPVKQKAPKPKKEVVITEEKTVSQPKKGLTTRVAGGRKLTESN